jgi:hypothetical protein
MAIQWRRRRGEAVVVAERATASSSFVVWVPPTVAEGSAGAGTHADAEFRRQMVSIESASSHHWERVKHVSGAVFGENYRGLRAAKWTGVLQKVTSEAARSCRSALLSGRWWSAPVRA